MSKIIKIDHNNQQNIFPSKLNTLPNISSNETYAWGGSISNGTGDNTVYITIPSINIPNALREGDILEYSNNNFTGSVTVTNVTTILLEDIDNHNTYIEAVVSDVLQGDEELFACKKIGSVYKDFARVIYGEGTAVYPYFGTFETGSTYLYEGYADDDIKVTGILTIQTISSIAYDDDANYYYQITSDVNFPSHSITIYNYAGIGGVSWIQNRNLANKALI